METTLINNFSRPYSIFLCILCELCGFWILSFREPACLDAIVDTIDHLQLHACDLALATELIEETVSGNGVAGCLLGSNWIGHAILGRQLPGGLPCPALFAGAGDPGRLIGDPVRYRILARGVYK